jgi:hypothetical protein
MGYEIQSMAPARFAAALACPSSTLTELALKSAEAVLLAPDHPFRQQGEWQGFLASRGDRVVSRLVASIDPRQTMRGRPVGALGFFAGSERAEPLASLFAAAEEWLVNQGASVARCPVHFSTWFGHRAVTAGFADEGGLSAFASEPQNPRSLVDVAEAAGYRAEHRATSHLVKNEHAIVGCTRGVERMEAAGFRDRPLDLVQLGTELQTLYRLVSRIFPGSWGYAEISFAEFAASFQQVAGAIDPDLVRIVESPAGEPVGFVYAYPDQDPSSPSVVSTAEGGSRRFILKTLGIVPEIRRTCPGLGSALTGIVHQIADEKGYSCGVHAFMAEGSYAQRTSARWGSRIRSYATFERCLQ